MTGPCSSINRNPRRHGRAPSKRHLLTSRTPVRLSGRTIPIPARPAPIRWPDGYYAAYAYDYRHHVSEGRENRLTAVSLGGVSQLSLAYDPLGRLQSTVSVTAGTTQFLYAGDALVGEYNGATLVDRYVPGPGTDEPLVWYPGAGTAAKNWLHADHQGSIVAQSDTTGAATRIYVYDPYGVPTTWGGSRYAYTGQIQLPEAQLYHYKARAYDPAAGWFLQTDPVGYKDNLDLYDYVNDDPVDKVDPEGKQEDKAIEEAGEVATEISESPAVAAVEATVGRFVEGGIVETQATEMTISANIGITVTVHSLTRSDDPHWLCEWPDFAGLNASGEDAGPAERLRRAETIGRPLGEPAFMDRLEHLSGRTLAAAKRGRKPLAGD